MAGQIVDDPKKLRKELQALDTSLKGEKATLKQLEQKRFDHSKQLEALESADKQVGSVRVTIVLRWYDSRVAVV